MTSSESVPASPIPAHLVPAPLVPTPPLNPAPFLVPVPLFSDLDSGRPILLGSGCLKIVSANPVAAPTLAAAAAFLSSTLGLGVEVEPGETPVVEVEPGSRRNVVPEQAPEPKHCSGVGVRYVLDPEAELPEGPEAYELAVGEAGAVITARSTAGLARGTATLAQVVHLDDAGDVYAPAGVVRDAPRFAWRGLSLDVARSFFPVEEVETIIDLLYRYKLNILHLHLTDDQGWRLEIPARPRLTDVSGATAGEGGRTGFYTVQDFQNIQDYAAARGITVVPEIDLPGHANAATHAIGALNPDGKPTAPYGGMRVGFSMLHPGLEETEPFLRDVIGSVAAQTQGDYVHFGGDEPLDMDPENYRELVTLIQEIVAENGKTAVAWQEAAAAPLPPSTIYQFWDMRPEATSVSDAVGGGAKVIMSPGNHAYLDMKYGEGEALGQDWAGLLELENSYKWDPARQLEGVGEGEVLGVEAAVWTETIHNLDDLTYMLLPRIVAVAELGWSPKEALNWGSFVTRVAPHGSVWDALGLSWHRSPGVAWEK